MGSNGGGFNFDLVKRNALLEGRGMPAPRAWKTGTTIAGVVYKVQARPPRWPDHARPRSAPPVRRAAAALPAAADAGCARPRMHARRSTHRPPRGGNQAVPVQPSRRPSTQTP
jgi:hypothetical protein